MRSSHSFLGIQQGMILTSRADRREKDDRLSSWEVVRP